MSRARRLIARFIVSAAWIGVAWNTAAASLVDPALRFRTMTTAHFSIHFHQGGDRIARRLAVIAEDTWRRLESSGVSPPAHTHVVLADQTELANGFATPLPYNTIMVTAVWPSGSDSLGRTDDWLGLAFIHEFTHIVHLERSRGWAHVVGRVFGRTALAFPNLFLPGWQIEGLATYEESAATGEGRLHAGDFQSIVNEAARASRLEPLSRVNGGLTDWPGETARYAYGAGFHAFLAERYGNESFARLADATAGRVPYTASRVFERIYGRSLGELWKDYEASVAGRLAAPIAPDALALPAPRRLTHRGFVVSGPRYDRGGCDGCVIYSARSPHEFPALYELSPDRGEPRRLATRYLGATAAVSGDAIYFDQQELRRNAGLYADLYVLDRATGRVAGLTREARLLDPDLAPDRRTIAAVRDLPDRRELVLVTLNQRAAPAITTLVSEADTHFNAPRWSPDGRSIAVERHAAGSLSAIAIVDRETRAVRIVTHDRSVRFVTPAWRPDGEALVVAADLDEGPFNLYEIDAAEAAAPALRPLTATTGGATWPDVSADGHRIVFVGYTVDGFDLFETPYRPSANDVRLKPDATGTRSSSPTGPSSPSGARVPVAGTPVASGLSRTFIDAEGPVASGLSRTFTELPGSPQDTPDGVSPYNPLATLRPTSWSPVIEADGRQVRIGFATGGIDVLGYHGYGLSATWLAGSPDEATHSRPAVPDWNLSYVYDRWRPAFWLAASSATSFSAGPPDARGTLATATLHERQIEGGVLLPVRHVRVSQQFLTSVVRGVNEVTTAAEIVDQDKTAWRAGWSINTTHRYGYSISPEGGVTVGATSEWSTAALGSSADASVVTADARVYLSPLARHQVLAVRVAGGRSNGDATIGRTFHLGGAQSNPEVLDFGRQAISLLRGFASDTFGGSRVAVVNLDYRWPIVRPQWGHGTWPVFLHTVHATVFGDAGHAWTRAFRTADVKTSAGGELSLDVVAGYSFPFTATVGAAWGHDGSGAVAGGGTIYVRVGRAF